MAMVATRHKALAQDLLQETFLRYFLTRMHGEEIADEGNWLRTVMRNLIVDWKKSLKAARVGCSGRRGGHRGHKHRTRKIARSAGP